MIRDATSQDFPKIKSLIRTAQINPTGLEWQRFIVAEYGSEIIGCGQIKPHRDGSKELASIATTQNYRGRGVASAIIKLLLDEHPGDLYLTCRESLGPFYERFGFQKIDIPEMPTYFRRINKIAALARSLRFLDEELLVMKRRV